MTSDFLYGILSGAGWMLFIVCVFAAFDVGRDADD